MIEIQKLTKKERKEFRSNARVSIMALPILMAIATFLTWIFNFSYWWAFLAWTVIISMIFFVIYMNQGKENIETDLEEGVKIQRMGKVKEAEIQRSASINTNLKSITITLEEEPVPGSYPEIHQFDIYNNLLQLYHEKDRSLPGHYKELEGETVIIEYFPYSGHVIAFGE